MPERIQLSRKKGWRMPPNTVSVTRPGFWGNPFVVSTAYAAGKGVGGFYIAVPTVADAVDCFRAMLAQDSEPGQRTYEMLMALPNLRGKNLACWCPLCDAHREGKPFGVECGDCSPCHSDVLGDLANRADACGGLHQQNQPCHADVLLELTNAQTS